MQRLLMCLLVLVATPAALAEDAQPSRPHQLTLYPVVPQLNAKFTEHVGTAMAYTWLVREGLGLQVLGQFNWTARESDFNRELISKVREQGQSATTNLLRWGATVGTEVSPVRGTLFVGETPLAYSGFLAVGAGTASTRSTLRKDPERGTIYVDTGNRLLAQAAVGLTAGLSERVSLRAEVRNFFYTSRIDSVNGCTLGQVNPNYGSYGSWSVLPPRGGRSRPSTVDGSNCRSDSLRKDDLPYASTLFADFSSDLLHLLHASLGVSVRF